jgi:hypothetical protein
MRAFNRSTMVTPRLLFSKEVEERRTRIADYIASVQDKGGQRRPPYWQDIFEDKRLAKDIATSFRHSCAYCERPARENEGLVHNHRPAALAAQKDGNTQLLNYVWLTFEWENILWVCNICARRKDNRFYALRPTREVGSDITSLRETEGALFLDPCFDVPHQHLQFSPDGRVVPLSKAGEETVSLLQLDGKDFAFERCRTSNALAALFRDLDRVKVVEVREGLGQSGQLFADNDSAFELLPYIGAATLGLLGWAQRNGLDGSNCHAFLTDLKAKSVSDRGEILKAYQRAIEREDRTLVVREEGPPSTRDVSRQPTRLILAKAPFSDARIQTVAIRNFKPLKHIELTLPPQVEDTRLIPCAVILGENASGKSSVLEAITLALLGTDGITTLDAKLNLAGYADDNRMIRRRGDAALPLPTKPVMDILAANIRNAFFKSQLTKSLPDAINNLFCRFLCSINESMNCDQI